MIRLSRILMIFLFSLLVGCATTVTAPGSFDESKSNENYFWKEISINKNFKEIYRHITQELPQCHPNEILVPPNISNSIYDDSGEARITMSTPNGIPRGAIRLKKVSHNNTNVRIGVLKSFENPVWRGRRGLTEAWAGIARGKKCGVN